MADDALYYENADFWKDEVFVGAEERFAGAETLVPRCATSLLDIGCGNGAFLRYFAARRTIPIHGTDRSAAALANVTAPKTQSAIDALPFADRAFDAATCLEVIEHLPVGVYERALAEIARVAARYIVIGVPFEEDIEADLIRCPSCTTRFNPDYHMRSFTKERVAELFDAHGFNAAAHAFSDGMPTFYGFTQLAEWRRRRGTRGNPFHTAIPCPMCDFMLPPAASAPSAPRAARPGNPVREAVKRMLRSGTDYGTIHMLFERAPSP